MNAMSTRATYQFRAEHKPAITIYVHHDGYPTGASSYFYDTLIAGHSGGLAEQFIRAVPRAEITGSHETHGDTEFNYTVTGDGPGATIEAEAVTGNYGDESRATRPIFSGTLAEFIDQNRPAFGVGGEEYHAFRPVTLPYHRAPVWMNLPTAIAEIEEKETASGRMRSSNLATLRMWKKSGACKPESGNFKSVSSRVHAIATAFDLGDVLAELKTLSLSTTQEPTA